MILEWEGSRCRRRRGAQGGGGRGGEGVFPPHWGRGWGGAVALRRKFFVFLLKMPYFDAF